MRAPPFLFQRLLTVLCAVLLCLCAAKAEEAAYRSLDREADIFKQQQRLEEALEKQLQALEAGEKSLAPNHPHIAVLSDHLALIFKDLQQYDDAEALYERAVMIYEKNHGRMHHDLASVLEHLAILYEFTGRLEEAEKTFLRVLQIREKVSGPQFVAAALLNLGDLYHRQHREELAEAMFKRAHDLSDKQIGAQGWIYLDSAESLADAYQRNGKYAEAAQVYQKGLRRLEEDRGEYHPELLPILKKIVPAYSNSGNHKDAIKASERALTIEEKELTSSKLAERLSDLAWLYLKAGDTEGASRVRERSAALFAPKEQKGTRISLLPKSWHFTIPKNWRDSSSLHFPSTDLNSLETSGTGADDVLTEVVNAVLPFEGCKFDGGERPRLRVYLSGETPSAILGRAAKEGVSVASKIAPSRVCRGTSPQSNKIRVGGWDCQKVSLCVWYGDHGGQVSVDFCPRRIGEESVVFLFMNDLGGQSEDPAAILDSFRTQ